MYHERRLDRCGSRKSKAQVIREFLERNADKAFYSTEIAEALRGETVKQWDVMSTIQRAERKGLVYI